MGKMFKFTEAMFRPISPRTLAVDTKVAELISHEGEWKRDMIQHHFIKEDAKIISMIPLPRHTTLWRRKVVPDPIYQRCKRGVEISIHAMVECKVARKIRQLSPLTAVEITASQGWNMFDVFLDTTRLLNKKETELQVAYWWATWNARNHFLFKKEKLDALISVAKAEDVVEAYR